jgi:hypothetical protein
MLSLLNFNLKFVKADTEGSYEIGNGDNIYQLEQLLGVYKTSSTEYQHNLLRYEISEYDSELATENYFTINNQYIQAVDKRAKLQATKELYEEYLATVDDPEVITEINSQLEAIDEQLEQYASSIASLAASKAEAKLQKDVERFYKDHVSLLKKEAENKLTNQFLKKLYSLMLMKEQQDYYEVYQKYLDTQVTIQQIKYQRGLTGKTALDLAEANLSKNSIDLEQNKDTFQSTIGGIQNDTGMNASFKIILPMTILDKEYDTENLIEAFENSNTNLAQLLQLKKCYQDYQYANGGSYTLYKQIGLKIQDYQLQYDDLKSDIESYVKDSVASYRRALQEYRLTIDELQLAENNYNIAVVKKEHRIATQLDLDKAEYEQKAAKVSYYQSIYNIIIWQNILDNCIYGETP